MSCCVALAQLVCALECDTSVGADVQLESGAKLYRLPSPRHRGHAVNAGALHDIPLRLAECVLFCCALMFCT